MKRFEMNEIAAAQDHAGDGGQALHLHTLNHGHPLFRRYPVIAHLFDGNIERLQQTARELGVRVIKVERVGQRGQHVDLCGKPLQRALERCEQPEMLL